MQTKNVRLASDKKADTREPPSKPSSNAKSTSQQAEQPRSAADQTEQKSVATPSQAPPKDTYQVFEQFNGSSIDGSLWQARSLPKGYRNHEEQDYSPAQAVVKNGNLQITATRDNAGNWHSAEIDSKWAYTYGDFEVRMALSQTAPGVWPAAWLLGLEDSWPDNGEIDMVEHINSENGVYGTIHGGGTNGHWQLQKTVWNIDFTQFHSYKIVKRPGVISWWIDNIMQAEWHQTQVGGGNVWPFENHKNIGILNLAIGGDWPGPSTPQTPDNVTLYVDYFTVKNAY